MCCEDEAVDEFRDRWYAAGLAALSSSDLRSKLASAEWDVEAALREAMQNGRPNVANEYVQQQQPTDAHTKRPSLDVLLSNELAQQQPSARGRRPSLDLLFPDEEHEQQQLASPPPSSGRRRRSDAPKRGSLVLAATASDGGSDEDESDAPETVHVSFDAKDMTLRQASLDAFNAEVAARGPRVVYMRFRLFDLKALDAVSGTAHIDFAVFLRWFDPSLVHISKEAFRRTAREYESLWTPKCEVNNAVELCERWDAETSWNLKDTATGEIKYSQRYVGTVANPMELRDFPFDADLVEVSLGPRVYKADKVVWEHDPAVSIEQMQLACPSLIDWDLVSASFAVAPSEGGHCHARLSILVHRRYAYYLNKVIAINFGAATLSWATFLMPPSMIEERLNLTVTLFLAEVAFVFMIGGELPKVPYMTLLDWIIMISFVMLFVMAIEAQLVYVISEQDAGRWLSGLWWIEGRPDELLDRTCFFAFPTVFTLLNGVLIRAGLKSRHRVRAGAAAGAATAVASTPSAGRTKKKSVLL